VTVARLNADRPSLVVDGTGRVHITFEDIGPEATHTNLVYATCTADCLTAANWQRVMVDPTPLTGAANSLVVDANGRVHVAYTNGTGFQIRYATCGANCTAASSWEIVGIGTPLGGGAPSLAVDPTGRVHISYGQFINFNDSELRYATCATRCMDLANWQFSLLAPATIRGTSLVVDAAGRLRLAYAGILTLQYSE